MLEQLHRQGPVVCAMSGCFTQRGEFAAVNKFARAEMAVRNGADLVLELPTPWAVSGAERFARGGVELLEKTGLVTHLAFGSECGDTAALLRTAKALEGNAFQAALRAELTKGDSFAAARQRAVAALLSPSDAALLSDPWSAKMTRLHNDTNMMALGAGVVGENLAWEIGRAHV